MNTFSLWAKQFEVSKQTIITAVTIAEGFMFIAISWLKHSTVSFFMAHDHASRSLKCRRTVAAVCSAVNFRHDVFMGILFELG
jgi:hypothetical protein